jgi:hypothetical protein
VKTARKGQALLLAVKSLSDTPFTVEFGEFKVVAGK